MTLRALCIGLLLTSCGGEPTSPPESTDCIVALNIDPAVFADIPNVRVISAPAATAPKSVPGCTRVLAAGFQLGAVTAEQWACDSRVPDAVLSVDAIDGPSKCGNTRPIPVLRYQRHPSLNQREETVQRGIGVWRARNGTTDKFDQIEDGELYCRAWPGRAPTAQCLIPEGRTWPGAAKSDHHLRDPAKAAWQWALDGWAKQKAGGPED